MPPASSAKPRIFRRRAFNQQNTKPQKRRGPTRSLARSLHISPACYASWAAAKNRQQTSRNSGCASAVSNKSRSIPTDGAAIAGRMR